MNDLAHIPRIIDASLTYLGFIRFNKIFDNGSNKLYDTKNIVKQALYCPCVMCRSSMRPSIFAFPLALLAQGKLAVEMLAHNIGS